MMHTTDSHVMGAADTAISVLPAAARDGIVMDLAATMRDIVADQCGLRATRMEHVGTMTRSIWRGARCVDVDVCDEVIIVTLADMDAPACTTSIPCSTAGAVRDALIGAGAEHLAAPVGA